MIRLAASVAWIKQRTAACDELSRIEYRISNDEGWNRFAKSFFKQTEYIHSTFDVGRSMFDVRVSRRHTALSLCFTNGAVQ